MCEGRGRGDQSGRSSQPVRMPLLSLPAVLLASIALATALPGPGQYLLIDGLLG